MIMVRQDAPGIYLRVHVPAYAQDRLLAFQHPFDAGADDMVVVKTGGGEDVAAVALMLEMGRRMPGGRLALAILQYFLPLLRRHLPPLVHHAHYPSIIRTQSSEYRLQPAPSFLSYSYSLIVTPSLINYLILKSGKRILFKQAEACTPNLGSEYAR
jgi:hypothetical protein